MIYRDLGYRRPLRIGERQRSFGLVHPAQPQIAVRTHAEMLEAMHPQGAIGYADLGADIQHKQRFNWIGSNRGKTPGRV